MELCAPDESRWTLPKKWPAHLSLHARVELPSGDDEEFDLPPFSGPGTFLARKKEILDRLWQLAEIGKAEGNPLIADGLHPNDEGHEKIARLILSYIEANLVK